MNKSEIKDRQQFIDVYTEFDKWLSSIGFSTVNTSTHSDYHYEVYNELIDPMYGVEHYQNEILTISIRFLRDRNEHKFIIVTGVLAQHSELLTIDAIKELILGQSIEVKKAKLKELESLILN